MQEWPGSPRFDESTEIWTYQVALDQGIYPRSTGADQEELPLTLENLKVSCWTRGAEQMPTEDIERFARNIWKDLSRPRLEMLIQEGLQQGSWAVFKKGTNEVLYTCEDAPLPSVRIGGEWILAEPRSTFAIQNDSLRPGRGPQLVSHVGTPREVMVKIWDDLDSFRNVQLSEIVITANERDTLDNTLLATWADRPPEAQSHVILQAVGQREIDGKTEKISLDFEGRFEQVRSMLSPIWPFNQQGDLDVTISLLLRFNPSISLNDEGIEAYRNAIMNANQGTVEVRVVPARRPRQ
jgi:hypothetical protein